ncbi:MAG TPA: DNA replication/repair protein RecF [Rhizomicrobium sp.]|nr:DNA replication/repair protein RecF [Rhizomicrobium sp.]
MTAAPDTRLSGGPIAIPAKLAVTRLTVANFRSYAAAELNTAGAAVVLAGPNGAGKTNLLEAISLLAPGRGLRGAKLAEHTRKGPSAPSDALWVVAATVKRGETDYEIGTGLSEQSPSRHVRLNGVEAKGSAELGEIVQMVWLTPAMDRLFIESASGRRRFLDRLVLGFDASHARAATRYETAMRERARLLKYGPRDPAWLDGLENEMAEAGLAVARARQAAVERLNTALATRVGAFPAAALTLAEEVYADQDALRGALAKSRIRDAESGRTLAGPHLTDLLARHVQKRADARDCSTGEQKALLIAIMLAFARELTTARDGLAPLLLLDEVAAHLDATRRAALFEEIADLKAQAWMTGTDLSLFETARAQIFEVQGGLFREVSA